MQKRVCTLLHEAAKLMQPCGPVAYSLPAGLSFRCSASAAGNATSAAVPAAAAARRAASDSATPSASSSEASASKAAASDHARVVKIVPKSGWAAVPNVPKFLGITGLIPFFALSPPVVKTAAEFASSYDSLAVFAGLCHSVYPVASALQIGYGTAIVSFLGAVHWGAGMQSRTGTTTKIMFERYIWSVMPALIVFPAPAMPGSSSHILMITALLTTFAIDAKFNVKGALPKWYLTLRVPLTIGAVSAMLLSLWHVSYEEQAALDYEHAVSEIPLVVEAEPEVVAFR